MEDDWKTLTVIDNDTIDVTVRLCYKNRSKRIDFRHMFNGYYTRNGVSLTSSEFKFLCDWIAAKQPPDENVSLYDVRIINVNNYMMKIVKNDKSFLLDLDLWKYITPYAPAIVYLISANAEIDILIDLYVLSKLMTQKDMMSQKWTDPGITNVNTDSCFLIDCGLTNKEAFKDRKINMKRLEVVTNADHALRDSLIKFMYK